ncbi:HNH endonuclease [Candidatus Parcubacteria bacterium]|nr:HNH endonuclease [Candidatus Parcubacteria bacterium]
MRKYPLYSVDIKNLKKMLYVEKKSHSQIGKILGVSGHTIKAWRRKLKLPERHCSDVKVKYWLGKKRPEIGEAISKAHQGKYDMEKNPAWKGGKIYRSGYCEIKVFKRSSHKSGYVKEHRLIMEKHLDRHLKPTEIVHHIDGNKLNNSISNLVITNRSDHASHHMKRNKFASKIKNIKQPPFPSS